jgi:DNA-binding NarL/FixJ family response regulator
VTDTIQATVLIVDDHPALAYGAKLYLQNSPLVAVVEIAKNGSEAIEIIDKITPHVVILDLHLPDMQGIDVARTIRNNYDSHIIIYTGDDRWARYFNKLLEIRISGIVHKKNSLEYLVRAVEGVLNGYAAIPLDIFFTLRCMGTIEESPYEILQTREINILRFIENGYTNQEISDQLFVSPKTIEHYLTQIYKKLGVSSRHEAVSKFKALNITDN